jgi:hypothetical protein
MPPANKDKDHTGEMAQHWMLPEVVAGRKHQQRILKPVPKSYQSLSKPIKFSLNFL